MLSRRSELFTNTMPLPETQSFKHQMKNRVINLGARLLMATAWCSTSSFCKEISIPPLRYLLSAAMMEGLNTLPDDKLKAMRSELVGNIDLQQTFQNMVVLGLLVINKGHVRVKK